MLIISHSGAPSGLCQQFIEIYQKRNFKINTPVIFQCFDTEKKIHFTNAIVTQKHILTINDRRLINYEKGTLLIS